MRDHGKVTRRAKRDDNATSVDASGESWSARLWVRIVVIVAALIPSQVLAGLGPAQWGMTPEQVAAAVGDEAPLNSGSSSDRLDGKAVGNVGTHEFKGRRLRAVYYYDERGLTMVMLRGNSKECQAIYQDLAAMYGAPRRVSNQIILKLIIWHDAAASNRIRLLVSKNVCDLHYERLDDYKAVDDEQAAKGH